MSRLAIICTPDYAACKTAADRLRAGALANGAAADLFDGTTDPAVLAGYDAAAFGLGTAANETAFLSLFARCLPKLAGKRTALFGGLMEMTALPKPLY